MTDRAISPLCRRTIEDMTGRGFTACTQRGYIVAVRTFTAFLGRSGLVDPTIRNRMTATTSTIRGISCLICDDWKGMRCFKTRSTIRMEMTAIG